MPSPRPQTLLASALALCAAAALGCVTHHHHRPARVTVVHQPAPTRTVVVHKGPPPHAPAHGYRHKYGDADLRYDKDLGVYVVLGHKTTYHDGHRFYRRRGNVWQVRTELKSGTWVSISTADIPPGLRLYYRHKARKNARQGQYPAKHE